MSEDYPLKVAYRLLGEPPSRWAGRSGGARQNGTQRGVLSRNVSQRSAQHAAAHHAGHDVRSIGPLDRDAVVSGDFHVTFENGIEAASGRTAFSTSFSARVQP